MPGKGVNDQQVRIYMESRNRGLTQVTSAVKSGISERSGRRIERGEIAAGRKSKRSWRTRKDPFDQVWENDIVPMMEEIPALKPITLFEHLQEKYPGRYPNSKLRTFQRRVKRWKALKGPEKEVIFRQVQEPGRMGLSDFTKLKKVEITTKGEKLSHRLYHFRLACSGWCDVKVILGGESYTALSEGLQNALWKLGGVPDEHRTDSLSAAYRNLSLDQQKDITKRYSELCAHYGMKATRNNLGVSHENGGIESPHGHLKNRIRQALLLRGGCDFESVKAYQHWIDDIVRGMNERNRDRIEVERGYLRPLPLKRTAGCTEKVTRVSTSSTIEVRRVLYTVPSRLIGEMLRLHIYDDRIEGWLGAVHAVTLPRIYRPGRNRRGRHVDYRHVIGSLERKPQAFRYSQIRDDLLPGDRYRMIWEWLDRELEPRKACKMIVGILGLAHRADCEEELGEHLERRREEGRIPRLDELTRCFDPKKAAAPRICVSNPSARLYDELLTGCYDREAN